MKIQCNVCDSKEANVVCCADEAALCWSCDEKVHEANKLASKHHRLPLINSSQVPNCDICQEMVGYFLCLEDRALLCRKCDIAIHTTNEFVSVHKRFLLTGTTVGLEPIDHRVPSSTGENISKLPNAKFISMTKKVNNQISGVSDSTEVLPSSVEQTGSYGQIKVSFAGGSAAGSTVPWQLDEFLELPKCNQNYSHMDHGQSKVVGSKFGESHWFSGSWTAGEDEGDIDEIFGEVPETSWTVPQIPSPYNILSELYWLKNSHMPPDSVFVPDVHQTRFKKQRHF